MFSNSRNLRGESLAAEALRTHWRRRASPQICGLGLSRSWESAVAPTRYGCLPFLHLAVSTGCIGP